MRPWILALALCASAFPALGSPGGDSLTAKFSDQEQILLSGVLADPARAAEFANDVSAGATEEAKVKWLARISEFSQGYVKRPHGYNDKAKQVKDMAEPAEWSMLMVTLRKMKNGGIMQQAKLKVFIGMIEDANDDLSRGDTEAAHKVIDLGRKSLVDAMNEYVASPNGQAGLAEAERLRKKPDVAPPPAQPNPAEPPPQVAKPGQKPPVSKPPQNPSRAIDQAEQARREAEEAARNRTPGNSPAFENGQPAEGNPSGVVSAPSGNAGQQPPSSLTPANPGGGKPSLVVKEPPEPGDDMAELREMKEGVKGKKTLYATIGGGVLGGILGIILGALIAGPVGAILLGAGLAAAGAFGGRAIGKKLWG